MYLEKGLLIIGRSKHDGITARLLGKAEASMVLNAFSKKLPFMPMFYDQFNRLMRPAEKMITFRRYPPFNGGGDHD